MCIAYLRAHINILIIRKIFSAPHVEVLSTTTKGGCIITQQTS